MLDIQVGAGKQRLLQTHMSCLSQTTGYAIQALACLDAEHFQPRMIKDVAACAKIPKPYLAKVVNLLSRRGIVTAKRGHRGGIVLARPPGSIPLIEIIEAVEGKHWGPCRIENCVAARVLCLTREYWRDVQKQIETKLRHATLADVIASRKSREADGARGKCKRRRQTNHALEVRAGPPDA